jgi:predicted DNA binding CopG/RHH family protein
MYIFSYYQEESARMHGARAGGDTMVKRKKEYSRVGEALREYVAAPVDVAAAIDAAEVVEDFLPPPKDLVLREPTVKVTLNLSRRSVDFFKRAALAQGVPYQQMVRRILDLYTERYD